MKKIFNKNYLFFALIFLIAGRLPAQQIDSLEKIIASKSQSDTQLVNTLNRISLELTFIDPMKSARYAREALQNSLKINYPAGQANGYRLLSSIFFSNNKTIIANEYLQRALKIFEKINDSAGIANCYITMGHAFRRTQNRQEEVEYHKRSFEIFSRLKVPSRVAVTAHNLGESYFTIGDMKKSRELTLHAIHLNDSLGNLSVLSNCYKVMGKLETAAGNYEEGENYFNQVFAVSEKLGPNSQKIAMVESMIELASIYRMNGQKELQLSLLKQAALFSKENLLSNYIRVIYTALITFYAGTKEEVLKYTNEYNEIYRYVVEGSLKNQSELEKFGTEVYKFLEDGYQKLENENLIKEDRIKNKNFLLTVSLIAGIILVGVLIILLRSLQKQKMAEREIKNKKEQLRQLADRLQNIREEERTLLAREVHEELGQQLIVLKMDISWIRDKLGKTDEKARIRTEEINTILGNALTSIKRIASSLRPSILDDIGLDVAIDWQLSEFEKRYGVATAFTKMENMLALPEKIKIGLFRIFQESLSNVAKYATAKKVTAVLQMVNKQVELIIQDDGVGFDFAAIGDKKNLGFLDMEERSIMLGGTCDIRSSPGKGTVVTVKLPLEK
jgi:signal transduction histidine kinase